MNREKALVKSTFIISLGTFLPKLTSLITLPILTANLTKTEYGTYDLVCTLVSLILPMATLKIDSAAFRFLIDCRKEKDKASSVITTLLSFLFPISVLIVIILYLVLYKLPLSTRILVVLFMLLNVLLSATQQIVRGLSSNIIYSVSAISNAVINMILVILTVQNMGKGLNGVLFSLSIALLIAILVVIFAGQIPSYWSTRRISLHLLKEMLEYSWPMIPNALSLWVMELSDRLVISVFLGIEANAIYAVANKIPNLFATFQGTFAFAWQENASIVVKDTDAKEYFSKMFDTIFSILTGILALMIVCTPMLFKLLINGDYSSAYPQMLILFGGMFFSAISSFVGGIFIAHKKTKSVGLTTLAAAGTNFLVNIMFIKTVGLYAASISTFISYTLLSIYRMVKIKRFQDINYNYKKMAICLTVLLLMCIICSRNNMLFNIFNLILGISFTIGINKNILLMVIRRVSNKCF